MAGHSDLGASTSTLPWEVHSSADRGRQGGGEETQESIERMSRHVSEVCEKIEAAKARKASVRETISHLQTKLLTQSAPREPNPPSPVPPEQLLRQVCDSVDEVARSSDLFSAIRRVVFPDLKQMDIETPQCKRPPPSDHEISDVDHVGTETEAEQMERLMQIKGENSQLVLFRKKASKKPKS